MKEPDTMRNTAPTTERTERTKREILLDLDLNPEQRRLVGFHSFVNLIHVLVLELKQLETATERDELFLDIRTGLLDLVDAFRYDNPVQPMMRRLTEMAIHLRSSLEPHGTAARHIFRMLDVAQVRIGEMLSRQSAGDVWIEMQHFEFRHSFQIVFEVMAERAADRYRIVFDERALPENSPVPAYGIILEIVSPDEETIHMPLLVQDIIRDLTANARKYSKPGSTILVRIEETREHLYVRIEDNGRGIPDQEVEKVIQFGRRGSNTGDTEMMGGGYGLTKAYSVVRSFGGRMWIATAVDGPRHGTTVEIRIPR